METLSFLPKYWYAIQSKPRQDKRVAAYLEKIGMEYYLPIIRKLRQWSDRKKWVEAAIMSPYVFVRTDEKNKNLVFSSGNVLSFVSRYGKAAVISENELNTIRQLCHYDRELKLSDRKIEKGDLVEIVEGPLAGMQGMAIQIEGKYKLHIALKETGIWASVHVELKHLRKLN